MCKMILLVPDFILSNSENDVYTCHKVSKYFVKWKEKSEPRLHLNEHKEVRIEHLNSITVMIYICSISLVPSDSVDFQFS